MQYSSDLLEEKIPGLNTPVAEQTFMSGLLNLRKLCALCQRGVNFSITIEWWSGETRIPVAVTKRTEIQNFLKFTVKSNKTRPVGDLNLM